MKIKERIRQVIDEVGSINIDKLKKIIGVTKRDRRRFKEVIDQMASEGSIHLDSHGNVKKGERVLKEGRFMATRHDYGFIENPDGEDYFVPPGKTAGAMDGDKVQFEIVSRERGRLVAKIHKVNRDKSFIVGKATIGKKRMSVIPDKKLDYPIRLSNIKDFHLRKDGKYKIKINDFDQRKQRYTGEVIEYLGKSGDRDVDLISIVAESGVPITFSKEVLDEATTVSALPIVNNNRRDFRNDLVVTIDGLDAKDFDDAISIYKEDDKYILTVHIADVSHYVKENSLLDREAIEREMSIYLPGLVIPMLPEQLSNGVCSLNPNVDRYTLSVTMEFSERSLPKLISINKGIIKSSYRLNYNDLNRFFSGESVKPYDTISDFLNTAREGYQILKRQSIERGTIEFESDESEITINDAGKVIDVKPRARGEAEELIEEFMIATNRLVATKYFNKMLPFLYRVHLAPSEDKINSLRELMMPYNLKVEEEMDAMAFQKLLEEAKEKEADRFEKINDIVLRSMTKAIYSDENDGHFALALDNYSHFTSPIRRYPDLFIHRIISLDLEGKLDKKKISSLAKKTNEIGDKASYVEKVILDLERDCVQLKKCEYMLDQIGKIYSGKVSGVTEFGIFVKLDNTVEGLVGVENLDRYQFDPKNMKAKVKGIVGDIEVGCSVSVRVINVSVNRMQIDFELVMEDELGEAVEDIGTK